MATANAHWQELEETQYYQFQKELLKVKGSDTQRKFLEAAKDNNEFVAIIKNQVETLGGTTLPTFNGLRTEAAFTEPTEDQELQMYQLWPGTPPSTACRASFWAEVTLEHIKGDQVQASWLAADRGGNESGEERIDWALAMSNDQSKEGKDIDGCVRTIFRKMSGLPERGNRSVFVDCSFGRGWWRERLISRILEREQDVEDRPTLLEAVRRNKEYWANLVMLIVSRGSVFGSADVQDAVINSLAKCIKRNPDTPLRYASTLRRAMRRLSNIAAAREIGVLEFGEISAIVDDLLDRIEQAHSPSLRN